MDNLMIEQAKFFAIGAHNAVGQKRKYNFAPYWTHCEAVAELVEMLGGDENMIMAAWLHDTVEDTQVTLGEINFLFGTDVASLVKDLTKVSRPEDGNRQIRDHIDRAHLAKTSKRGQEVKCCDIAHNVADIALFDPNYAKIYVRAKQEVLDVMTLASAPYRELAQNAIDTALDNIASQGF
jgi:(p)ppGpp synthase/HD superfamily hydrolase